MSLYPGKTFLSIFRKSAHSPSMFIRNALVIHQLGGSSGTGLDTLRLKGRSFGHSLVYTSLKHGKPMAFERALIRAAGMAFFVLKHHLEDTPHLGILPSSGCTQRPPFQSTGERPPPEKDPAGKGQERPTNRLMRRQGRARSRNRPVRAPPWP